MADNVYKLDAIQATRVAAEDIDKTFRSSCIGMIHVSPPISE
jgi:hypothetical protein